MPYFTNLRIFEIQIHNKIPFPYKLLFVLKQLNLTKKKYENECLYRLFWLENKIAENQWKIADRSFF
jgi:hypothetical protein